ncbi:MAG TPA: HAD-IA family hydrolase [Gemmata sp.]|nr:HAD-IA family hydrolase [Gemmata sp.]
MLGRIPPRTKAVFFDAVGTLLFPDPPAQVVYAEVARRAGVELSPADVRKRFLAAYRAEDEVDRHAGWVTSEQREVNRWRRIVDQSLAGVPDPENCFQELFGHFAKPTSWRLEPDTGAVFSNLRDCGLLLGLGSNYDARLFQVVAGFPALVPLRERVVVSAAVGFRKPAKEFFRAMARSANCLPEEMCFVGDDFENDYQGASAAGLFAVLFDPTNRLPSVAKRIERLVELCGHSR